MAIIKKIRGLLIFTLFFINICLPLDSSMPWNTVMLLSFIKLISIVLIIFLVNSIVKKEKIFKCVPKSIFSHKILVEMVVLSVCSYIFLYIFNGNLNSVLTIPSTRPIIVVISLFTALSAGFAEEYFVRGYLFNLVQRILKKIRCGKYTLVTTSIITSLIFGSLHLFNLTGGAPAINVIQQVFYAVCFGFLFSSLRLITNTIFWGAILHFIFDFQMSISSGPGSSSWEQIILVFSTIAILNLVIIMLLETYLKNKEITLLDV